MRTSFHHQPEAQHPKFFSYPQAAGRLPIYRVKADFEQATSVIVLCARQGASLSNGAGAIRSIFGLMGRDNSLLV